MSSGLLVVVVGHLILLPVGGKALRAPACQIGRLLPVCFHANFAKGGAIYILKYFVSQEKLNFVSSLRKGAGAMVYIDIMQVVVKKMDSRRNFPRSDFH